MLTKQENELLCRVEGDAPMGQIMRRHWLPACLTEEVADPDCDPVRVRLLGENLVAFRDSEGRKELCPKRPIGALWVVPLKRLILRRKPSVGLGHAVAPFG